MANQRKKILADLSQQTEKYGTSPEHVAILTWLATSAKTSNQWSMWVNVNWHSTGPMSYQVDREYLPTPELIQLHNGKSN